MEQETTARRKFQFDCDNCKLDVQMKAEAPKFGGEMEIECEMCGHSQMVGFGIPG